ncbi:MAG: tetratricopeptide repeat protein [Prevotella sp.]|nr:tetratricopeptide repeat protein [Prevotella sp.]
MAFKEIRMMMNNDLMDVYDRLNSKGLSSAISAMEIYLSKYPNQALSDRLYAIQADFQRMADYWKQGYKDPQLPTLYTQLLHRLYVIYVDAQINHAVGQSTFLSAVYMRLRMTARNWSVQTLREALESYVSDMAMMELEPSHVRDKHEKELHRQHHQLMSEWFDNLWLSSIWTDGQASAIEEILLSPTIESYDQQLLASAITIAVINHFDMAKFRLLLHVYQQATDENIRQRALVGWVMALCSETATCLYGEEMEELKNLLADKAVCLELMQLQQQIIYCVNAEKDHQTIQKEIIPDLLKNGNYKITRNGIEEVEEDSLNDILHPDEEERRMEQMEESFQRMQDMQKQGSDIYFGGFSQMKRFSFFQDMSNWFVPFYEDHPGIAEVTERFKNNQFLSSIFNVAPFCNSDKYSFVLAFSQVVDRIPKDMLQMFERGEASFGEVAQEVLSSTAYIRRLYLQDLYRFYKIFSHRSEFRSPFEHMDEIFFANPIFRDTPLETCFNDVAAFLIKQHRWNEAVKVLDNCGKAHRDFRFYMMAGYLSMRSGCSFVNMFDEAVSLYEKALALEPEDEKAHLGHARALFVFGNYKEALNEYNYLLKVQPDKKSYLLNRAVCLSKLSRHEEALKDLYRLNYESPDDMNVNRVMAWVLTCNDKYEQADKIYSQLVADHAQPEDLLNYGYCLWLSGKNGEAVGCFQRYLKETEKDALSMINGERPLLEEKGITEAEMQTMLYML